MTSLDDQVLLPGGISFNVREYGSMQFLMIAPRIRSFKRLVTLITFELIWHQIKYGGARAWVSIPIRRVLQTRARTSWCRAN